MANRRGKSGNSDTFLGSKITEDGDCSHEIKRHLLLGRKAMTSLDRILKSRDITLLTKVHLVKAMVFPVVMYRCELDHKEGWAPKNWCFWTVVLEKTLESPLDCKEIKPVNPKEINPEYSLEGLILKLKLQYFGHLMRRVDQEYFDECHAIYVCTCSKNHIDSGKWKVFHCCTRNIEAWRVAIHGVAKSWTRLSDWSDLIWS